MNCKTHKTYRGIRKPTSTCFKCRCIFHWRRIRKFFGLVVAEQKPRRGSFFEHVIAPTPPSPEHDAHVARRKQNDPELKELEENLRLPIVVPPVIAVGGAKALTLEIGARTPGLLFTEDQKELASIQESANKRAEVFDAAAGIGPSTVRHIPPPPEQFLFIGGPWHGELHAPGPAVWSTEQPNFIAPLTVRGTEYELRDFTGCVGTIHRVYVANGSDIVQAHKLVLEFEATGVCPPLPKSSTLSPELAAQLKLYQSGTLTEHETTALFLKLVDAGVFGGAKPK